MPEGYPICLKGSKVICDLISQWTVKKFLSFSFFFFLSVGGLINYPCEFNKLLSLVVVGVLRFRRVYLASRYPGVRLWQGQVKLRAEIYSASSSSLSTVANMHQELKRGWDGVRPKRFPCLSLYPTTLFPETIYKVATLVTAWRRLPPHQNSGNPCN